MTEQKKAVFMMRAKGQSFEDFKEACVEAFRKAGLLTEGKRPEPEQNKLDGDQKNPEVNNNTTKGGC